MGERVLLFSLTILIIFFLVFALSEGLQNFYQIQFLNHYDHIPKDILEKHEETIKEIDEIIEKNNIDSVMTSQAEGFDLKSYSRSIAMDILHEAQFQDKLSNELKEEIKILNLDIAEELEKQTLREWLRNWL